MLNRRDVSGHPWLVSDFSGITISLLPLRIIPAVCWLLVAYVMRCVPSVPALDRVFMVNVCWILLNAFLHLWSDLCVVYFVLVFFSPFPVLVFWVVDLLLSSHPQKPGVNPTLTWHFIFLMCCWFLFANILLRIIPLTFHRDICL